MLRSLLIVAASVVLLASHTNAPSPSPTPNAQQVEGLAQMHDMLTKDLTTFDGVWGYAHAPATLCGYMQSNGVASMVALCTSWGHRVAYPRWKTARAMYVRFAAILARGEAQAKAGTLSPLDYAGYGGAMERFITTKSTLSMTLEKDLNTDSLVLKMMSQNNPAGAQRLNKSRAKYRYAKFGAFNPMTQSAITASPS